MESFLRALISVSVVLGIMIFVHEWGHFIAAKLCGVRVDVFSFGFGPRLFGVKRGDTDYRLSALPFGGYVRMAGDNVVEERTGADYEYLSKTRWQRVFIAVAGPAMNILLAFMIFWGIYWFVGVPFESDLRQPADVIAIPASSPITDGVRAGDRIVAINGEATPTWEKVLSRINKAVAGSTVNITVARNGKEEKLSLLVPKKATSADALVGYPKLEPVVDDVAIGFPAERAGLKSGDLITAIDGKPVSTWYQLVDAVHASDGRAVTFTVRRDGKDQSIVITPMSGMGSDGQSVWQIGVSPKTHDGFEREGLAAAIKDAALETYLNMRQIVQVIAGLFNGKVSIREL
jgi:regulator of sigma E protease